ncbi:MAG: hypothetical protein E7467_08210 [Ruminococcaceae bacterium]|nr:hypothetical protein [Oscillospiraceae bacterium]
MKKALCIVCTLTILLLFVACQNNSDSKEEAFEESSISTESQPLTTEAPTTVAPPEPCWSIEHYVDDFGDETDGAYLLGGPFYGEFSNTATTGSPLKIYCYSSPFFTNYYDSSINSIDGDAADSISFRLLEYNDTKATYYSSSDITLKIKIGNQTYEAELWGSSPNGDLYLFSETFDRTEIYNALFDALYENQPVRCIIEIDHSKYSFEIDGLGYSDSIAALADEFEYSGRFKYD